MQPRFPRELSAWMAAVEQMLLQHRVDMARLWKTTPQIPDPEAGTAMAAGLNPEHWIQYGSSQPGSGTVFSGIQGSGTQGS